MQPTTREKFVSYLDTKLQNSSISQFGEEARKDRQEAMESKYGADMSNNTASRETTISVVLSKGQTQLIGDRPSVDIEKHTIDEQGKYFEANAVTKSEGSLEEKIKLGFEDVNKAFKEKLSKADIGREKFKVVGLKEVGNAGIVKDFEKANYFDKAEIKKFVNLDPEKTPVVDTTNPMAVTVENSTRENADKLIEGLYGTGFKDKLNLLLDQRLDHTTKVAGDPTFDFIARLETLANLNPTLASGISKDDIKGMLIDAIKVSLLTNPDKIKDLLDALATDPIDVSAIPELTNNIENGIVKIVADKFVLTNHTFFSLPTSAATEHAENIKKLVKAIKDGKPAAPPFKLKKNGTKVTLLAGVLPSMKTNIAFTTISTSKFGPRRALPEVQNLNSFKTDLYSGLRIGISGDVSKMLKTISRAMVAGNAEEILKYAYKEALVPATEGAKPYMDRLTLFAKLENKLSEEANKVPITPSLKNRLEKIIETLEQYSTPEGIAVGIQSDLLLKISDKLTTAGVISNTEKANIQLAIEEALKQRPIDKSIVERVSILTAGVADSTLRGELHNSLRAVVNIELIRAIAMNNAGSTDINLQKQYMLVLLNKFAFTDGKAGENSKLLLDLLYAKPGADKVISLDIASDASLKAYLEKLLGPTATIKAKLEVNGQASNGYIYSKAHELYGIVRKGVEAGEWNSLTTDDDKKKYIVENFGLKADDPNLDQALKRFNEIVAAGGTGELLLSTVIGNAKDGTPTKYGSNYTNLMRMFRHYIINGGDLKEILKNFENQTVTQFIESVQTQANDRLGITEGDIANDKNKVLSLEEQRASVLKNYEELSGKQGFTGFLKRMVASVPRVIKAAGIMAITSLGAVFPVVAGPIALGLVAVRLFSAYKIFNAGIPMLKETWEKGDSKRAWAMIGGLTAGIAISLIPSPWGIALGTVGEIVGADLFVASKLKKEAALVLDAHTQYEQGVKTYFNKLISPKDDTTIRKIANTLGASIKNTASGEIDITNTWKEIEQTRDKARKEGNMTILREYSQIIESLTVSEVEKVREANLKAKAIYDSTQKTVMAYSLASSAAKLGIAVGRGVGMGWNDGEGGIVGGVLGGLGIADYRTLLDFDGSESASADTDTTNLTEANINQLQDSLESQLDTFVEGKGGDADDSTVLGLAHTAEGKTVVLIDTDDNPDTVETFLPVNPDGKIDFSTISITETQTQSGSTETVTGLEAINYVAQPGDSQWSLIENVLDQRYPNATDQQIWTMTANVINEAGTGEVYQQIYEHRVGESAGAVQLGDKLTLQDISEMAPNQFTRAETNLGVTTTPTSANDTVETQFDLPTNEMPENITGVIGFDSPDGPLVAGDIGFLNSYVANFSATGDDSASMTAATSTTTDDQTDDDDQTTDRNWRELILGKAPSETGTGGSAPTNEATQTTAAAQPDSDSATPDQTQQQNQPATEYNGILDWIATTTTNAANAVEEDIPNADRAGRGISTLMENIGQVMSSPYNDNPSFDNNFSNNPEYNIDNEGINMNNSQIPYTATDTGLPAYLGQLSVELADGTHKSVDLVDVVRFNDDYLTYIDSETNQQVTVQGEVKGIGHSYSYDNTTNTVTKVDAYEFDFDPNGQVTLEKVEKPWWDPKDIKMRVENPISAPVAPTQTATPAQPTSTPSSSTFTQPEPSTDYNNTIQNQTVRAE